MASSDSWAITESLSRAFTSISKAIREISIKHRFSDLQVTDGDEPPAKEPALVAAWSANITSEEAGSSHVTWKMTGPRTLAVKIMGVFSSMDSMIGKDFERGLAQLKSGLEAEPQS